MHPSLHMYFWPMVLLFYCFVANVLDRTGVLLSAIILTLLSSKFLIFHILEAFLTTKTLHTFFDRE